MNDDEGVTGVNDELFALLLAGPVIGDATVTTRPAPAVHHYPDVCPGGADLIRGDADG